MSITLPTLQNFSAFTQTEIIGSISLVFLGLICAVFTAFYCSREFRGDRKKTVLVFAGITLLITLSLISFFGFSATAIRGVILCLTLAFCSCSDIKTRECPDYPYIIIAVAAFIGIELTALPGMLFGAFSVFVIQFYGAWVTRATLNGADLKLSTACAFLLGTTHGILGLLIGMLLGIIVNLFRSRDTKAGFPLIPYLAVGFMAAYFL